MASKDGKTLVKGISTTVLQHYDQFQMALDRMEKYHSFSNDFQVMSFSKVDKVALDNIIDMFEDEDAKKLISSQINILKMQKKGGEANVFRGSSKPGSKRFYKYMFIARVNYDDTVDFNLCSMEKQGNWDVTKTLFEIYGEFGDTLFRFLTGTAVVDAAKEFAVAWAQALGLASHRLQALEQGEFITEFDMTKRLIDGNYCEFDKEKKQVFLKN
ncbi:hypothetical protein I4U23_025086 [Adineta vaga]|nr:hypothetical protein I4U23_025086 [Adineta vaga]